MIGQSSSIPQCPAAIVFPIALLPGVASIVHCKSTALGPQDLPSVWPCLYAAKHKDTTVPTPCWPSIQELFLGWAAISRTLWASHQWPHAHDGHASILRHVCRAVHKPEVGRGPETRSQHGQTVGCRRRCAWGWQLSEVKRGEEGSCMRRLRRRG